MTLSWKEYCILIIWDTNETFAKWCQNVDMSLPRISQQMDIKWCQTLGHDYTLNNIANGYKRDHRINES